MDDETLEALEEAGATVITFCCMTLVAFSVIYAIYLAL